MAGVTGFEPVPAVLEVTSTIISAENCAFFITKGGILMDKSKIIDELIYLEESYLEVLDNIENSPLNSEERIAAAKSINSVLAHGSITKETLQ
jgi:hypothetical protein